MRPIPVAYLSLILCLTVTAGYAQANENPLAQQTFDPTACRAGTFDIYFQPAQFKLSSDARTEIRFVQHVLSICQIDHVRVVEPSDAALNTTHGQKAMKARADAIVAALTSTTLPRNKFEVVARGDSEASLASNERGRLMPRRVEITIQASPSTQPSNFKSAEF